MRILHLSSLLVLVSSILADGKAPAPLNYLSLEMNYLMRQRDWQQQGAIANCLSPHNCAQLVIECTYTHGPQPITCISNSRGHISLYTPKSPIM